MTLAARIRDAITRTGKNLNTVAKESGVTQPVLQRFMSGERDILLTKTAQKLCKYLGLELREKK